MLTSWVVVANDDAIVDLANIDLNINKEEVGDKTFTLAMKEEEKGGEAFASTLQSLCPLFPL